MGKLKILTDGLVKENPVLRLVLGTCPTLALTTAVSNAFGMGFAATFVLVCSNIAISALRKVIPGQVRLPAYITVIATFVTIVQNLVKAYFPDLDAALGVYLPLIVVNCIILGRAEAFASKNPVGASAVDGICQGIGYTLVLICMCVVRELLGSGKFGGGLLGGGGLGSAPGITIFPEEFGIKILTMPVGGFLTLACVIAAMQYFLSKPKKDDKKEEVAK